MDDLERGLEYKNGHDYKEAIKCFQRAAEDGNPMAYAHLGIMYEDGLGFKPDLGKAIECYAESASLGFAWAQCRLGLILASSGGDEKEKEDNDCKAVVLYEAAAKQGDKDAQFNLGMMLAHGRGGEKNIPLAVTWLDKAAAQGHRDAFIWAIQLKGELDEPAVSDVKF